MTNFIDNLLTQMSSAFNQKSQSGEININLTEDKTLKWRGLYNNRYATKRRSKRSKNSETDGEDDSDSNSNVDISSLKHEDNDNDHDDTENDARVAEDGAMAAELPECDIECKQGQDNNIGCSTISTLDGDKDDSDDKSTIQQQQQQQQDDKKLIKIKSSKINIDKSERVLRRKQNESNSIEEKVDSGLYLPMSNSGTHDEPMSIDKEKEKEKDDDRDKNKIIIRRRGRSQRNVNDAEMSASDGASVTTNEEVRKRGRKKKDTTKPLSTEIVTDDVKPNENETKPDNSVSSQNSEEDASAPPKKKRGRRKLNQNANVVEVKIEDNKNTDITENPIRITELDGKEQKPNIVENLLSDDSQLSQDTDIKTEDDQDLPKKTRRKRQKINLPVKLPDDGSTENQSKSEELELSVDKTKVESEFIELKMEPTTPSEESSPDKPQYTTEEVPPLDQIEVSSKPRLIMKIRSNNLNTSEMKAPKKRGRKPKIRPVEHSVEMLVPNTKELKEKMTTRSSPQKKSSRLSNNGSESILASAIARKEKINEQVGPQQRLSRRIKPTAKILANEELRQGFELQNSARLSFSSESLDQEGDSTPKKDVRIMKEVEKKIYRENNKQKDFLFRNRDEVILVEPSTLSLAVGNHNEIDAKRKLFVKDEFEISSPSSEVSPPTSATILSSPPSFLTRPQRKPCPEPEEFLHEIKASKIALHRSPEDNKKLNKKQQRRLSKLKEKHFHKLGLQKNPKNIDSCSNSDEFSDDNEEFVPNKKVSVGKTGVTLRLRNHHSRHDAELTVVNPKTAATSSTAASLAPNSHTKRRNLINDRIINIRNPKNCLLVSKRRKTETIECNGEDKHIRHKEKQNQTSLLNNKENHIILQELDDTICLCRKSTQYFIRRTNESGYCSAVDQIESQKVGCSNELKGDLHNLVRPSKRVSYMALCEAHKRRFFAHNCCAGCGIFCTQGTFILCSRNHFFHRDCAMKYILNTPYDPDNMDIDFICPTLVLKCPHCGIDAPDTDFRVTMSCQRTPVFLPSQRNYITPAKMSMNRNNNGSMLNGSGSSYSINALDNIPKIRTTIDVDKLIPESILNTLANAQSMVDLGNFNFTTRDLFNAINNDDVERVAEIIASGFNILLPLREFHGGTCLHMVASFGSITMTYIILCRMVSPDFLNILNKEMRTALMCAVVSDKNDIIKLLVQCGANVAIKGQDGMTALHLAAKCGNFIATQILVEFYRQSVSLRKFELFINSIDDGSWTPLVWAAEHGHSNIVSYLINLGADANICDTENNTVLHWAALSNSIDTVLPLLQSNCDFNMQNINGDTPLHIASRMSNSCICLVLLAHGSNLTIKNEANETPYDCVPDDHSPCARALKFNLQLRQLAGINERKIICHDISNGREIYPIQMIRFFNNNNNISNKLIKHNDNDVIIHEELDDINLPDFKYITKTILLQNSIHIDQCISQMRICSCSDNCTSNNCQCSEISVQNWYNSDGKLINDFNYVDPPMIFECNDVCGCNKLTCKNRIVQKGIKIPLQIYECADKVKGWGVKCLTNIQKGTFIAEYTGEILTDFEADRRTDDSYFFDLGASGHCIDANFYGNVSRFFNHSCDSNIVPIQVYFDHQDLRFPKIAFFALRDIDAGEEISFDYGEKFWMVKYKYFTCFCNTNKCRYSKQIIHKTIEEYNQRNINIV